MTPGPWQRIIPLVFLAALVFAFLGAVYLSLKKPHGDMDAWAIWNLRARFLFRAGEHWTEAFNPILGWSHLDYPLLLSGFIARCWKYLGTDSLVIPILTSMFFTFGSVGLAVASISILRSASQGLLAGLVLLGTQEFIYIGVSQYADMPLGFFFLATMVLLALQERFMGENYSLAFLAGLSAGLAAWTKNEGFLFLAAIFISFFVMIQMRGWKIYKNVMLFFVVGLLPILLVIMFFKLYFAPPNDLFGRNIHSVISGLFDVSRCLVVAKAFLYNFIYWGNSKINVPLILLAYLLLIGVTLNKGDNRTIIINSISVISLMLLGYFLVFIITPHDLLWHLHTALGRLFLQLWPSLIFIFFLLVRTPEMAFRRHKLEAG